MPNSLPAEFTLYTIDEIADILKVTQRTIYNYIKSGDLTAIKIGKYWRVKHTDLAQFLATGTNLKTQVL
ncbi:MAG: helix-turn-helix domain-containing protein [Acholeplasmataceae bacterium]|nr:helix-turn-helix domain-containing protein [Acholeplasmataceae bacterium]